MTISRVPVVRRAVVGVALPVLLLTGCADRAAPAAEPSSGPTRTVPGDFCDRLDYTVAVPAFVKAMPIPAQDVDRGPDASCSKGFFSGDEFAGGFVMVKTQTFDSAAQARTAFERTAGGDAAEQFAGGAEIVADEVRYLQIRGDARITVLDANVMMEIRLVSPTPVGDEQAAALPPSAVRVAVQALELIRVA
ncbi:hypothetical protein KIF24_12330 [Micromonospora sp. Llam7]|uniref:hypothetical protein n=1 Tax=Micromonospora tarapacensis TaxID=2835305 RepID=UPI001C82CEE0|nr:hypothetical protein [Micromonospora tarapacensis]MBX7266742.1 hypothetical protein [Micromonospora tarapacensis]